MERTRRLSILVFAGLLLAFSAPALLSAEPCILVDTPLVLDPPNCDYHSLGLKHGPDLDIAKLQHAIHKRFINRSQSNGGILGGTVNKFSSSLQIEVAGTGQFKGYNRTITLDADCEAHAGPWDPNESVISFDTHMVRIEGSLENDPDFESFRIVGGLDNGYPSPGHQTAARQEDGTYALDSMFQIGFRVEYVGAPGGAFEGYAGSSEGTATVKAFNPSGNSDSTN